VALLLAFGFLWLAVTRCYQQYVTPRTLPYLYFAAAALAAIGIYDLSKLFEATHIRRYTHLLAILIPLALLAASTNVKGLWTSSLFPATNDALVSPILQEQTYTMTADGYQGRVLHGYNASEKTLTVMENETFFWLTEIYTDPTPFLGFTVTTMGQVLKSFSSLSSDCFSPIRELMSCCVADTYKIGFKCQYDMTQALAEGDWVTVTGELAMVDADGVQELRILVNEVEPCSPPEEPYVYAY
ncbi:MAG: TIGR03943 family protein, partial [Eubacteriales bacterium]|nr:TIGR03943 family protein [Eubacteriales bacterium]